MKLALRLGPLQGALREAEKAFSWRSPGRALELLWSGVVLAFTPSPRIS